LRLLMRGAAHERAAGPLFGTLVIGWPVDPHR
jgi:hypothetical protein